MKYLFFDTETTGLPREYLDFRHHRAKYYWKKARMIELAWYLTDEQANVLLQGSYIKAADDWIFADKEFSEAWSVTHVLEEFLSACNKADVLVGHNVSDFDVNIIGYELICSGIDHDRLVSKPQICTMANSIDFCAIPYWGEGYKYPSLMELYQSCFNGRSFDDAHTALADVAATRDCYFELLRQGVEMWQYTPEPDSAFTKPKPKSPRQLPDGVTEHSLEGVDWVCRNSAAKKRLQGVLDSLEKHGLTIGDLDYDARIGFATNCIKKGWDFFPRTHFAHDGTHIGRKISSYKSEELISIWHSWGGSRLGWDRRLKEYSRFMRSSMHTYFEKVEVNVKKRRSEIRKVLKRRKGYEDFFE